MGSGVASHSSQQAGLSITTTSQMHLISTLHLCTCTLHLLLLV
jgi:hypothetical protein